MVICHIYGGQYKLLAEMICIGWGAGIVITLNTPVLTKFCYSTMANKMTNVKVKQYIDVLSYAKIVFELGDLDNKSGF